MFSSLPLWFRRWCWWCRPSVITDYFGEVETNQNGERQIWSGLIICAIWALKEPEKRSGSSQRFSAMSSGRGAPETIWNRAADGCAASHPVIGWTKLKHANICRLSWLLLLGVLLVSMLHSTRKYQSAAVSFPPAIHFCDFFLLLFMPVFFRFLQMLQKNYPTKRLIHW